jgi:hypothetical protein
VQLDTKSSASLDVVTETDFGVDLDHPYMYGLKFWVPELSINIDLLGHQDITNRVKTKDPVGFIDLTLDTVSIRFNNGALPDYNNPGNVIGFGFNDSAQQKAGTGYFGPIYLQNMRAGIVWGDWIIQLGAAGTDYFWDPWHREQTGYSYMDSGWAYLDTRVQYLRPLVPKVIQAGLNDETDYWIYDSQSALFGPHGADPKDIEGLTPNYGGTMIGLQYVGSEFSAMFKLSTQYAWDSPQITSSKSNGIALGLDYSFTPGAALKGFRVLGNVITGLYERPGAAVATTAASAPSTGSSSDPGVSAGSSTTALPAGVTSPNMIAGGLKVGYDIPLPRWALHITSIEPYVGLEASQPLYLIPSDNGQTPAAEVSAGFTLHWPGIQGWGYDYLQRESGRTGNVYSGMTFAYKTYVPDVTIPKPVHSLLVTLYNDPDQGLIDQSAAELVAQWFDFANASGVNVFELTAYVDHALPSPTGGILVPWTKVYYDNYQLNPGDSRSNNLMVFAGLKLRKLVRNTEFGLSYESRNLFASPDSTSNVSGYGATGIVKASVDISL